jgi:HSP20 family molecular chaperone IbpA
VNIQRTEANSIARELERLNDAITRRAYELYEQNHLPSVLDNWIAAEHELIRRPLVELHEEGKDVEVLVGMEDIEPDDIEVQVAAQDLLIRARGQLEARVEQQRDDRVAPERAADVIGIVHLSGRIDPDSVNAEYHDGQLRIVLQAIGSFTGA